MTKNASANLKIWQESYNLTLEVYRLSHDLPPEEKFGLISQMRRSASSVCANIAEGYGRVTDSDKRRLFAIARGSARETTIHCMLARDLKYVDAVLANSLIERYNGLAAGITSFMIRLDNSS
jgi:four helix bundle protein